MPKILYFSRTLVQNLIKPGGEGDAQTAEDAIAELPEETPEPESTPLDAMIWDVSQMPVLPDDPDDWT